MSKLKLAVLLFGTMFLSCGCSGGEVKKYQARGVVLVNGTPTPLVQIQLRRVGESVSGKGVTGNASYPTAVTGDDGTFTLSTDKVGDGVYPGEYVVTFTHLTGNTPTAGDRFKGAYGDPDKSPFRVTIEPQPTELPPFELAFDYRSGRAPKKAGGHPATP
jgi:hypothetical protein